MFISILRYLDNLGKSVLPTHTSEHERYTNTSMSSTNTAMKNTSTADKPPYVHIVNVDKNESDRDPESGMIISNRALNNYPFAPNSNQQ